jgi:hypothetical protein
MKTLSFIQFINESNDAAELEALFKAGKVLVFKDTGGLSTAETLDAAKGFGLRKNSDGEWVNKRGKGPYVVYKKGDEPKLEKGSRSTEAMFGKNKNTGD